MPFCRALRGFLGVHGIFQAFSHASDSGKVFASQERVSGFPEKGLTSGEAWETSGEVRGTSGETSGELPGKPWIAVKFHSERTSGEVAEKLPGKFGELPGKSRGTSGEARGSLTPSQRLAKVVPVVTLCL